MDVHIRFCLALCIILLFARLEMKFMISFIFIYGDLTINLKSHFELMQTTVMDFIQYPYHKNILYIFGFVCTLENVNSQEFGEQVKIYIQHISLMNVCFTVNHVKDIPCKIKTVWYKISVKTFSMFECCFIMVYILYAIVCNVVLLYFPFYTTNNNHIILLNIKS